MELLAKAEKNRERAQHAANAVCFLRILVKHLTENMSAAHLISFVNEAPEPHLSNGSNGNSGRIPPLVLFVHNLATIFLHLISALPLHF